MKNQWISEKIIRQPIRQGNPDFSFTHVYWDRMECREYITKWEYGHQTMFIAHLKYSIQDEDPCEDIDTWLEENMPF